MVRFGEFDLDVASRQLLRRGTPVHLEPQAFDLLTYLVEHRDRVVPNAELLDGVWGHRFTSAASLTTRVKEVRHALGDDGTRQHSVKNVRGRGYQFVAPVQPIERLPAGADSTVLIGREREMAALTAEIAASALVTVIGPGGVGKSTLAREFAAREGESFSDGTQFVELAAVDAEEQILPALARSLDVVLDVGRRDDALASIARLDALLVLDNCEQVADEVADLVVELWASPEVNLRVLATSRVALGLSRERVIPLSSLDLESAGALFTARSRAVVPGWDPGSIEPERIAQLVQGLDRLPLTIEMAAARAGSMSFDELASAIADGTPFLQVSHRSPARRHRSLDSLVAWSAGLLDARHRRIFEDFSVFAGGAAAHDVAAVLAPDDPSGVVFDLAALAERSLLVAELDDVRSRYSMLVTVRTVAQRWLEDSVRADPLRRRHAEHFLVVAREVDDELRTPRESAARRRIEGVVDELRAAHRWARAEAPELAAAMSGALFHAAYSSLWNEPATWSRELLSSAFAADPSSFPGARLLAAGAAAHAGDLVWARRQVTIVLGTARGRIRAAAVELLADIALYEGDLAGAHDAAAELRRLGEELDDSHARAFAAVDASLASTYGGDPATALAQLADVAVDQFAPTDRAWIALARGDGLSMMREREAASAYLEAIEIGGLVENRFVVSCARTSLANEYARVGDVGAALEAYAQSLADFQRHGNTTHAVTAIRNLIGFLADLGDDRAATVLGAAASNDGLRMSYGVEAERVERVLEAVERRAGAGRFSAWWDEGRSLDAERALQTAIDVVAGHRS